MSAKNHHIVFYTDTPLYGGAERAMLLLAKFLSKKNYTVTLICSDYPSLVTWRDDWKREGFNVKSLKVWHKHDPRHYFQLKRQLLELKPDVFHIHLWNPASCRYAFGAFAAVKKKLPLLKLVTTEHDPFPLEGAKKRFKKWALGLTDRIIAVSNANRELLIDLYPEIKDKILMIHNGLDLEDWKVRLANIVDQNTQKVDLKKEIFEAEARETIFLTIATLHPRKGLVYLIKAYAEVIKKYAATKLVIVGEGPQYQELQELIKNLNLDHKVVLQGYSEDVVLYLANSDIFVLPSVKEAFGLVLLEAMVAGLPIIASEVGGIPEIIVNERNGLLVKAADVVALTVAMIKLLEDKNLTDTIAANNKEDVKKFDAEQMALKTAKLYGEL